MRSKKTYRKIVTADTLYGNRMVARFINRVMLSGKKSIAEHLVYRALDILKEKGEDPIKTFELAVNNVGPKMEVKARRVGGASYQVPTEVRGDRRIALALRWIVMFAKKRSNSEFHTFSEKLAAEIIDASKNLGEAIKKRDTVQRMADANKAFAHFRW
jgi:small subunit ribosomal protein S7